MNGIVPAPAVRAMEIDQRIREIDATWKKSFVEMGYLLNEAENKQLWQYLADEHGNKYRSLDHWLSVALPISRSSAYAAKSLVKNLSGIPRAELEAIPRTNLPLLQLLPERERPKWVEAATVNGHDDFRSLLMDKKPDLLLEYRIRRTFSFTASQDEIVQGALELAMARNETESREQALEAICSNYLLDEK